MGTLNKATETSWEDPVQCYQVNKSLHLHVLSQKQK